MIDALIELLPLLVLTSLTIGVLAWSVVRYRKTKDPKVITRTISAVIGVTLLCWLIADTWPLIDEALFWNNFNNQ